MCPKFYLIKNSRLTCFHSKLQRKQYLGYGLFLKKKQTQNFDQLFSGRRWYRVLFGFQLQVLAQIKHIA